MTMKQFFACLFMLTFTFSFTGCTTTYDRGNGTIVDVKKIKDKDYKPHAATNKGAKVGGTIGAIGGAAAGGFVGLALGAFAYVSGPVLIATTLGGAAVGAVIVGGVGAVAGGGLGYAVDVTSPRAGLYQYLVKPDNGPQNLTVTQYSAPMPLHARVHILENNDALFLKDSDERY